MLKLYLSGRNCVCVALLVIGESNDVAVRDRVHGPRGLGIQPASLFGCSHVANRIHSAFKGMGDDVSEFYMAITAEDSSIVYYKLSKGLVKPQL